MMTVVLADGRRDALRTATRLATALCVRAPDQLLRADAVAVAKDVVLGPDAMLVVGSGVTDGAPDARLLEVLGGLDLAGTVVFLASVGAWPAETRTAERQLRPVVRAAGGWCPAPVLHCAGDDPRAVAAFCRYWRPVVAALADTAAARPPSEGTVAA